jgi:DNA-binding protein YbaB
MRMTSGIAGNEFDDLFEQARQALDQVRRGEPAADAPEPEPVSGDAAEGRVRAVLAPTGKLTEITVDPKLLREGIEEVCAQIVVAVNAAIDELRARATPVGAVDPETLAATLREVQTESARRMAAFGTVVDDVVKRLIETGQRR